MGRYTAVPSETFEHGLRKLSPKDQKRVMDKIFFLEENPRHPSLRTQKLHGEDELLESSISMDIRIVWSYEDDGTILMQDVGHHDILRKY